MSQRANVTSVEALESFRARLILYLSKARPALEEVGVEVFRTRTWLEHEQRVYWENQVRHRGRVLQEAQQALFSARLAGRGETASLEEAAVQRARRALEEAETKRRRVKQWNREFASRIEPLAKQLDPLRGILATDLPRAVTDLAALTKTLADYSGITAGDSSPSQAPSLGTDSPGPEPSPPLRPDLSSGQNHASSSEPSTPS